MVQSARKYEQAQTHKGKKKESENFKKSELRLGNVEKKRIEIRKVSMRQEKKRYSEFDKKKDKSKTKRGERKRTGEDEEDANEEVSKNTGRRIILNKDSWKNQSARRLICFNFSSSSSWSSWSL